MNRSPYFEIEVFGDYALFSDPIMRAGGERCSYPVPTYEALKGVMNSIYWKPTIEWFVDEARIMNQIRTESHGVSLLKYRDSSSKDLAYNMYLSNVRYQVKAHFEWNMNHPEMKADRDMKKHCAIIDRSIAVGGRRDVFLGARECQADVIPCVFGEGSGFYDNTPEIRIGVMEHGFTYPDQAYNDATRGNLTVRFWDVIMKSGIIKFIRPEDVQMTKVMHPGKIKTFSSMLENLVSASGEVR